MTIKETRSFLERIKVYYPTFAIDDYITEEWHSQLKDYSAQDVNERFNQHLKHEEYSKYIPKISFLTNYLLKENEKDSQRLKQLRCICSLCKRSVPVVDYQEHYRKCNSIDYIIRQIKKYKNLDVKWKDVEELTDEKFNNLYEKVLNLTLKEGSEREKESITKYRESLENDRLCNLETDATLD